MAGNVVIAISSENVWIQAADGTRRVAKAGDLVQESDTLIVADGQEVILQGPDELPISVEPGQFSFAELQNQFDQALGQTGEDEIAALQQSILEGVDPTQTFEAAAAGEEAPVEASDGGSSVSTIARSAEEVIAQGGFDTGAASASAERAALADGAENLAPVITAASPDLITDEDVNLVITTEQLISNVTDPDGDVLSVQSLQLSNPDAGTLVDNGDGTWTLALTPNWNGAVSLSYTVVDAVGNTVENSANVNVTPVNDAPIISVDDAALSAVEDGASVSGNASFTDVDTNDTHTYSVSNLPAEQGSVSIDPVTGEYTYSPEGAFQSLALGETATVSFDVTVTDREGATDTETVTVTITGTNDAPELSVGNLTASEDGPSVTGNASFTDVDSSDTHTYSVSSLPAEQGSVSIDPATGEYTYNPGSSFQSLAAGETTTVSFDITVTDNHGATDTETVTVTITGTNDAPELSVGNLTASEDSLSVTGNASFTDVDANDTHTYSVSGLPAGQGSVSIDSATGQYTYSPGSAFQSLAAGQSTTVSFNVTVTDNNGASDTETVTVTIVGTNDGPVAVNDVASTSEDTPINNINVLGNDSDAEGDALSVTEANAENGSVTINPDGTLNYTPKSNFNGTDTITYTISDGNGGTSTATVTVRVGAEDDAPILTVDNAEVSLSESATAGVIAGADADATDADGDTPTFSLVGNVPANANGEPLFSIDTNTGQISLTAAGEAELDFDTAPDSYQLTVQASDGKNVSNTETITIKLSNENDNAPVLTVENSEVTISESATAGVIAGADADATDADGDTPIFSLVGVPTNANGEPLFSIDTNTGQISLTAAGEAELDFDTAPDSYQLTVQASDGKNVSNTETITIKLSNENDNAPVLTVENSEVTISESATAGVIAGADANATDADGDTPIFSLVGVPTNANGEALFSIDTSTGQISLTAAGEAELDFDTAPDSYQLTVQASDGKNVSNTETITIKLSNENEAPTAEDDHYDSPKETLLFSESFEDMYSGNTWTVVHSDPEPDADKQWTIGDAGIEVQNNALGIATATDGQNYAELDPHGGSNAVISKDIDTSGQDHIRIEFDYNPRTDGNDSSNMTFTVGNTTYLVKADGTLFLQNADGSLSAPADGVIITQGNNGWYHVSGEFDVNGAQTPISFAGAGGVDRVGAFLDNIKVTGLQDTLVTNEDTPLTILVSELLGNDHDPDAGDVLRLDSIKLTDDSHGKVELSDDGKSIIFTPDANYHGDASFTYTVTDKDGLTSNDAKVTIKVNPVDDKPTSDSFTVESSGREASIDFATDSGHSHSQPDGNKIDGSEVHDQDGDAISIQVDSLPDAAVGTLWWDSDGNGTYDTQVTQEMLDAEGGFKADTNSLQYQLNDGLPSHLSAGGQLDGNNHLSDWGIANAGDSSGTSTYAGGATIKVTGSGGLYQNTYAGSDDGGGIGVGKGGELDKNGESISIEFDAPNAVVSTVSLSLTGMGGWYEQGNKHESQATVKVYDTNGNLIDPALLTFTTVNAGSGSTSTVSDGTSADGDISVSNNTFFINNHDTQPANANGSDYLTQNVSISVSDSSISIGKVEIGQHNVKGHIGSFEVLNVGADITYTNSFTYHPVDSQGNAGEQSTVTIHSSPDNSAPEAKADQFTTSEDNAISIDLLANDTDADGDDLHIAKIAGQTITEGQAQQIDVGNGIVNIDADGNMTFTPDADFRGDVAFQYTVADSNGGSADATATVSVKATVDEPTMKAAPESASPVEGQSVAVDASLDASSDSHETGSSVTAQNLSQGLSVSEVDGKLQFTTAGDGEYKAEIVGSVQEDNGTFVEAVREVTVTTETTHEQKANTTYGSQGEGVYELSENATDLEVDLDFFDVRDNLGSYDNSFGVYFADSDGKPISGFIVDTWVTPSDESGHHKLHIDAAHVPDGAKGLGFFLISDGEDQNSFKGYDTLAKVDFAQNSDGSYNGYIGGQQIEVKDGNEDDVEPILFSNPELNPSGYDHEMQSGSGYLWEDIVKNPIDTSDTDDADVGVSHTLTETLAHTTTKVEVGETQLRYHGTDSDDLLIGSDGDDLLIGGLGDDQLEGGAGADTFKWQAGDADGSTDNVVDFNPDQGDVLDISELLTEFKEGDAISNYLNASISDDGQDMVIGVDANGDGSTDLTINLEGYAQTHSITSDGLGETTSASDELNRLLDNNGQDPNII